MKKICLCIVLSIVSVFSISAQTSDKSAANADQLEVVEVESERPNAGTGTVEPIRKSSETTFPTESRPRPVEKVDDSEFQGLRLKNSSLGALSTGNLTVDGYIEEFSTLYDIDPLLIYAQMNQESSFKGRATSPKGASGFMQLMPGTARRFGVTNIYNTKQNIKAGVKYMRWLLDKFGGDMRLALAGYNAGEGAVIKYGNKIPPYRETRNYVTKIMNHYELITNRNMVVAENDRRSNK